jgi:AbrB family looped-hinge helix DNA binding protein
VDWLDRRLFMAPSLVNGPGCPEGEDSGPEMLLGVRQPAARRRGPEGRVETIPASRVAGGFGQACRGSILDGTSSKFPPRRLRSCYPEDEIEAVIMTVIVKSKTDLVVPQSVRRRAGIKAGDRLEFKVSGGVIHIVPKLPSANDEYTPQQRRAVDRALAEGMDDIEKGRLNGPFDTHDAMIEFLDRQASNAPGKPKKQPKRR